jgi:predicted MFS family arabinose efflux permease
VEHALARFRAYTERWYIAYLLFGASTGVTDIFLPLLVSRAGDASHVGMVIAAIGLGGLTAALWGDLADRLGRHRGLFVGWSAIAALAVAACGATTSTPAWIGLAFLLGMAAAATNTVASLLVVERHPQPEWDARIGYLQTFYNAGIVAGLVTAGALSQLPLGIGLVVAAAAHAAAGLVGWVMCPAPSRPGAEDTGAVPATWASRRAERQARRRAALARLRLRVSQVQWAPLSPLGLVHAPRPATLAHLRAAVRSPFGLFLLMWVVCNLGTNAVSTLYPLVLQQVYGVAAGPASFALAAATGIGLVIYPRTSLLTNRFGGVRVLQVALGARLLTFAVLIVLVGATFAGREAAVLLAFVLIELAWPAMSVSSALLTSELSLDDEGKGMGLYNTAAAFAGLGGAVLGGWVAARAGYASTLWLAAIALAAGLLLTAFLRAASQRTAAPPASAPQ